MKDEIEAALNSIRPAMEADGGGVEFVSINNEIVTIKLLGTCLACPSSSLTLKFGIEKTLKEKFPWIKEVVRQQG